MFNLASKLETIRLEFNKDNEDLLIDLTTNNPRPTESFLGLEIVTPYIQQEKRGEISYETVEGEYREYRRSQPRFIVSVVAFSRDSESDATTKILNAVAWFQHYAYDKLAENDIIIVDVENVQDQSVVFIDQHEYRYAFDITIRTNSEVYRVVENVEIVEVDVDGRIINITEV